PAMLIKMEEERVHELQRRAEHEADVAGKEREDARRHQRQERGARIRRELVPIELRGALRSAVANMMPRVHAQVTTLVVMNEVMVERVNEIGDEEEADHGECNPRDVEDHRATRASNVLAARRSRRLDASSAHEGQAGAAIDTR